MGNPTKELRRMLDELGVKPMKAYTRIYKGYENPVNHYTTWKSSYGAICWYHENEEQGSESFTCLKIEGYDLTPEQAIAATVGVGTCELINAADDLGKGTSSCMCSKCGYTALDDWWDEFKYCPNCRAEIKED